MAPINQVLQTNQARPQDQQNLLHSPSLNGPPGRAASFYKQIFLDVVSVLMAFAVGFFLSAYFGNRLGMSWLLISLTVFTLIVFFSALLSEAPARRAVMVALQAAAFTFWLPFISIGFMAIFFFVITIILGMSEYALRRELKYVTRIRFFRLSRPYISNMVTLLVLMMIVFYLPGVLAGKALISGQKLTAFGDGLERVVRVFYPDLPQSPTAGELSKTIVTRQFKDNPEFQKLSPADQQRSIDMGSNQLLNELSAQAALRIKASDRLDSLAQILLQSAADRWRAQYGIWFITFWVVITFVIVRSLGFVFTFVVAGIAYAIYELLVASKVLVLQGENAMRETVTLS